MNRSRSSRMLYALLFAVSVIPAGAYAQAAASQAASGAEITLPQEVLAQYVGNYELAPNVLMAMTLDDGALFTQLPGQPKFAVFPESETRFALKVVPAAIEFEKDASGTVVAAVLHQNGRTARAPRIGAGGPPAASP